MQPQLKNRSAVKTLLRFTLRTTAALALLFAAAVVVMHSINWRQYTDAIAEVVKERTGRRLEIGGPVKVGFFQLAFSSTM